VKTIHVLTLGAILLVGGSVAADEPLATPSTRYEVASEPDLPYRRNDVDIDPSHPYTLPELIDLAQRNNPVTRIAWEQARQAAAAVGLVEATYLPQLSAQVLGGYQHTPIAVPLAIDPKGNMMADTEEALPSLVVEWLLFDFGRRDAMADATKMMAKAADTGFTGAHQKLIYDVAKAYYALDAVRSQVRVAESAVNSAKVIEEAATARNQRGLATVTEVATARRGSAKARFELEQSRTADNDAYHALLENMGLNPTLKMQIASSAGRKMPADLAQNADDAIRTALVRRPDIVAALAKLKASEAGVRAAEAAFYPKVSLAGSVGQNIGNLHLNPSSFGGTGDFNRVDEPFGAVMLQFSLPLFDGGLREKNESIARSRQREAEEELSKTQDEAIRQVARAFDTVKSALAEYDAAGAYVDAAEKEAESALEAYQHGVGTLIVATTADTNRTQAQSARARAYAGVLTAAAVLAFTTGSLTSIEELN